MSHERNCPDEYAAREQARRDAERDHDYFGRDTCRLPYECDEANDAYRREYRHSFEEQEEEARMKCQRERMREEARQEEEWAEQQSYEAERQRAEEEAYWAEQYTASVDTRPEGGDSTKIEAPFTGGAVPKGQTPNA